MPEVWEGWRFGHDGSLCGPDGYTFQPGQVLASVFHRDQFQSYRAFARRYRQDAEHAHQVMALSLELRRALDQVQGLFDRARLLLGNPAPPSPASPAAFSQEDEALLAAYDRGCEV